MVVTKKKTIFVIDDEMEFGQLIKEYLEENEVDCSVMVFKDLVTPLELIDDNNLPDLVITDFKLNKSNGAKLSEFIKSNPATSDIPVIIMSAFFHGRNVSDAIGSGCDEILEKPFTSEQLKRQIRKLIHIE